MSIKKYLIEKQKTRFKIGNVNVFIKNNQIRDLNSKKAILQALKKVPRHLLINLRNIHIGSFEELDRRELQALYKDSTIYLSNSHKSESDMIDDIVHEIAHSVEEAYGEVIYSDDSIEREFIVKRKKLWSLLKDKGFEKEIGIFLDTKYSLDLDNFFYKEVGYPLMSSIASNLFYSPYAATSLREYFANGFEAFFMKEDVARLKNVSPALYKKMLYLMELKNDF